MDSNNKVEIPDKFKDIVSTVEKMSTLDLSELVHILEDKFGVSSAPAMVVQAGSAGDGDNIDAAAQQEKTSFNVELKETGEQKIQVIKVIKEALGLGLKEAKDLVDKAPTMLKEGLKKEEAETLKKNIEAAGGKVELK